MRLREGYSIFPGFKLVLFATALILGSTANAARTMIWEMLDDDQRGWQYLNTIDSPSLSSLRYGDFNGDGKADVFRATGKIWEVSYGGTGQWEQLNTSAIRVSKLAFGDFNGDGVTDVFYPNGEIWQVSWGGVSQWAQLQTSTIGLNQLGFGTFCASSLAAEHPITDVFRATGHSGSWEVSCGGTGQWVVIQSSTVHMGHLAFGDFNGDGYTDVFRATGGRNGKWEVSYSSPDGAPSRMGQWKQIAKSKYRLRSLYFGDFDGDGVTDILRIRGGEFLVSWGGITDWERWKRVGLLRGKDYGFADFNGDGMTDVLRSASRL